MSSPSSSSCIPISSKCVVVIRNTSSLSLSLMLSQQLQLLYKILFLYYFFHCITRTTIQEKDGGGDYYVDAAVSSSPSTFDHDDSMSTNSNPYHPTTGNSKSTSLVRNVEVVSHIIKNNSKDVNVNAEPFVLGSTINMTLAADLTSPCTDATVNIISDCLITSEYVGMWYTFTATEDVYAVQVCSSMNSPFVAIFAVADNSTNNNNNNGTTQSLLQCIVTREQPYYNYDYCLGYLLIKPFQTVPGQVYYVFVGKKGCDSTYNNYMIIDFSIRTILPIRNDECSNAEPFVVGSTIAVSTYYATFDSVLTNNTNCQSYTPPFNVLGVWYTFTATAGETYAIEVCGTQLYLDINVIVFSGNCSNLECVVAATLVYCNGDPLILNAVQGQQQYYIFVSSSGEQSFNLKILSIRPVSNDLCTNAAPYPLGLRIIVDTTYATTDDGYRCPLQSISGPGVWYTIVGTGQNISARPLLKKLTTSIGIYTGTCDTNSSTSLLQCIAVNNPLSTCSGPACDLNLANFFDYRVNFVSVRGTTYYIHVVTRDKGRTPILIRSKCGLLGLQSIFCPLTFNGIVGRLFRRLFYEFGKLIDK
jgi:hypothetical protein